MWWVWVGEGVIIRPPNPLYFPVHTNLDIETYTIANPGFINACDQDADNHPPNAFGQLVRNLKILGKYGNTLSNLHLL